MKLSIILPTYNRSHLLKDSIEDLLKQTYKNIEIIIINDGSTDNTENVVKNIIDSRIIYIKNKTNRGIEYSESNAIKKCTGDFITFISDDDRYIDYTFFSTAMEKVSVNTDIISAKYETIFNGTRLKNNFIPKSVYRNSEIMENFFLFKEQLVIGGNTIYNKKLFKEDIYVNGVDYSVLFKLLYNSKEIIFINKVVFLWHLDTNKNSISRSFFNPYPSIMRNLEFIETINNYLSKKNDLLQYEDLINKYIFNTLENAKMNYFLTKNLDIFTKIIGELKNKKYIYIYGKGMIGNELKKFLDIQNIHVKGYIDDLREDKQTYDISSIDKTSTVIIASYKDTVIHKIYKKLIKHGFCNTNIIELDYLKDNQ